ncbi:MAG: hypothetical protein OXI61_12355 [Candidatus Poribacteria bacterium]|nr:hypothetical protein [Candidatus Poribacteria bacterium]
MKQGFFYEPNCVENGEWIPEKETLEDMLVLDLRFIWNHRYHLERRYIQQYLRGNAAAIWRFKRQQKETRKKLIRELRAYRSNREFAPDLHQFLETWYLQNHKTRMDIAWIVKRLLTLSWVENPDLFRNAEKWEHKLQSNEETQTQNRLKQLPLNVQKQLYEIAGMAGTNCPNWGSTAYNQATTAFLVATSEELQDFLYDHARYNLEHRISWHDVMQEVYRTSRQKRVYREYLRSPEWQRKRQAVLNRAMQPCIPESPVIRRTHDEYGRLIEFIETEWKPTCERVECSQIAEHVHHYNYERVGKELIGMDPEASEENDLIALCPQCHAALHAKGKSLRIHN